jgi:hypothetical protein
MAFVTFTYNPTPAPACYPPDLNGLAEVLTTGGILSGEIPDNAGGGIYVGTTAPPSALAQKVWFRTDIAGRPIGVYQYYNGNWRRIYDGNLGDLKWYAGSNAAFDATGRGTIGGTQDGWALCNGQNGTPNLEAYHLVAGQWGSANDGSGAIGWISDTDGLYWRTSGGAKRNQINPINLPPLQTSIIGAGGGRWQSGGGGDWLDTPPWEQKAPDQTYRLRVADMNGNDVGTNADMPKPLFYVAALLMFVGYA